MSCHCGNKPSFEQCCQPIILGQQQADSPEKLMRSRYSAYVVSDCAYIQRTYSKQHHDIPDTEDIRQHAQGTQWLKLTIENSHSVMNSGQVEFRAFYQSGKSLYQLHELSEFIIENGQWRYLSGDILADSGPL